MQRDSPDADRASLLKRSDLRAEVVDALLPMMTDTTSGWSVEVLAPSLETSSLQGSVTTWVATATSRWMVKGEDGARVMYRHCSAEELRSSMDQVCRVGWRNDLRSNEVGGRPCLMVSMRWSLLPRAGWAESSERPAGRQAGRLRSRRSRTSTRRRLLGSGPAASCKQW